MALFFFWAWHTDEAKTRRQMKAKIDFKIMSKANKLKKIRWDCSNRYSLIQRKKYLF